MLSDIFLFRMDFNGVVVYIDGQVGWKVLSNELIGASDEISLVRVEILVVIDGIVHFEFVVVGKIVGFEAQSVFVETWQQL